MILVNPHEEPGPRPISVSSNGKNIVKNLTLKWRYHAKIQMFAKFK